jgi:hypothetical protein
LAFLVWQNFESTIFIKEHNFSTSTDKDSFTGVLNIRFGTDFLFLSELTFSSEKDS